MKARLPHEYKAKGASNMNQMNQKAHKMQEAIE